MKGTHFLAGHCESEEQRTRVEKLIAEHARPDSLFDLPSTHPSPQLVQPYDRIGDYHLREKIGEGGMGVVYVAEQEKPVRRKVALKVIKPGMDSADIIARFEAERQALAMMEHPNIAKVLDAGTTDEGRPYFVMELVKGIPITRYCDEAKLSVSNRLQLFSRVCKAVQHAHQKGIIHRDIKPTNVLVTLHDGEPVPKVIDFGVAKAMNQRLTDRTIYTSYSQVIGTPTYMSPEQAELSGLDVDTRSDVYALGVLLYELLTGTTPFDEARISQAAFDEWRRIIREEEPPKPSTRISTLGNQTNVFLGRDTTCAKLQQLVRGDLDWIVMKALEKSRTRRYETANDFAVDVQKYLSGQPIDARPPSFAYRFSKFVSRNRMATVATILFLLSMGLALSVLTLSLTRSNQLLSSLQATAMREAVVAAVSGNRQRTEIAIKEAARAGVAAGDTKLIEGILALIQGEYDETKKCADESLDLPSLTRGPDKVGALALRTTADFWSGRFDLAELDGHLLQDAKPSSDLESLLKAFGLLGHNPKTALTILESNTQLHRSSLGVYIEGQGLLFVSTDQGDVELLRCAVEKLEASKHLLGESPLTLGSLLQAYGVGIQYSKAQGHGAATDDFERKGRQIWDRFDGSKPPFTWGLWDFAQAVGDDEASLRAARRVPPYLAALCLQNRNGQDGLDYFDQQIISDDVKLNTIFRAHLMKSAGEPSSELRASLTPLLHDPSPIVRRHAMAALCLACDESELKALAVSGAHGRLESRFDDLWIGESCYRLLAGRIGESQLLQQADGHRYSLANAYFTLAMHSLAKKNRQAALSNFEKCRQTQAFGAMDYELAVAYVDRMTDDSSWLETSNK